MAKKVSEAQLHITGKDKTKTAFNSVQGRLQRMKNGLMGVKGAIGLLGVASIGVFVKMAKDAANTADEIRKMSGRIGITTDALQEMRFAFGLAGVEGDILTKGLLNFSKSLGEARVGTGALTTFLKKSDEALLAQLVSAKNNTQALDIFFKAMANTTNEADKLALSSAALGRAGKLMTTAFENGAGAFAEAREEAHRLGLIIDRELLENAEAMNDQLSIVSQVISVQLTAAFLELAPAIQKSAKSLTDLLVLFRKGNSIVLTSNSKFSILERTVRSLAFGLDLIGIKIAKLLGLPGLEKVFDERALKQAQDLIDAMKEQKEKPFANLGDLTKGPPSGALPSGKKIKSRPIVDPHDLDLLGILDQDRDEMFAKMFEDSKKTSFMEKAIFEWKLKQLAIDESIWKLAKEERKREFEARLSIIKSHELERKILGLKIEGQHESVELIERREKIEAQLGEKMGEEQLSHLKHHIRLIGQLNRQLEFQNDLAGIGERVFQRMGDGWIEALQRGENAFDSLKNVALAALFDIGQEMFRIAAIEPLTKAGGSLFASIGKAIGGSLFGGGGGGGGGNTFDAFGDMLAHGGTARGGKTHLVGEQGPELFIPNTTGTIIPNNQLGGGVTNVTLNISTGVQGTVRAEIMDLMPQITEQVKYAVAEARQRGGAFSTAMGV